MESLAGFMQQVQKQFKKDCINYSDDTFYSNESAGCDEFLDHVKCRNCGMTGLIDADVENCPNCESENLEFLDD